MMSLLMWVGGLASAPPPPPGTCQWCGHCCGVVPAVLPPWPKTYVMNESTVIMPCNNTGLIDPLNPDANDFHRWSFASIDWSNAKIGPLGWAKGRPMDAEDSLVQQAALLTAANPKQKVGVYRNIVKALPWFPSIAAKLRDPAYSGWFLPFKDSSSKTAASRCDTPHRPQKQECSMLYHDQLQTPQYPPRGDAFSANCSSPGCDCGGVPCGEYLWDHRNASMREWLVNEHILGDTALGNPNISAIYLDDNWQNFSGGETKNPFGGPSEENSSCINDMGFTQQDVNEQTDGWKLTMLAVQQAVIKAGGWSWAWFLPAKPAPTNGNKGECTAYFNHPTTKSYAAGAIQMSMAHTLTHGTTPASLGSYKYTTPVEDTASFLLVRGEYAWLGAGWAGCNNYPAFIPEFDKDYGVPLDATYAETAVGSAVFARKWSHADVRFDCNTGKGSIDMY